MAANVVPFGRKPAPAAADRTPRHNFEAEQALLGSLMANNKRFDAIADQLHPKHFYSPLHARMYGEIAKQIVSGRQAMPVTMRAWIEADQEGAEAGGADYIRALTTAFRGGEVETFARVIIDCWQRREVAAAATSLYRMSFDPATSITDEIQRHTDALDATAVGDGGDGSVTFDEALGMAIRNAKKAKAAGGKTDLHLSTFPRTMRAMSFQPEQLTILGGASGEGKSALAWGWAIEIARDMRDKIKAGASPQEIGGVVGISLEMSAEGIATRALSAFSGISAQKIERGWLSDSEIERLDEGRVELSGCPLRLEAIGGLTPALIRMRMRQIRRKFGGKIALVVIDHVQLVEADSEHAKGGGAWATGKVADAILRIAKEFHTHVLALSQVDSKDIAKRQEKRPTADDLRWSANFRQNADNILFVHRPEAHLGPKNVTQEPYEPDDKFQERKQKIANLYERYEGKAELIIAKARQGELCSIEYLFDGPTTTFSEDPYYARK